MGIVVSIGLICIGNVMYEYAYQRGSTNIALLGWMMTIFGSIQLFASFLMRIGELI